MTFRPHQRYPHITNVCLQIGSFNGFIENDVIEEAGAFLDHIDHTITKSSEIWPNLNLDSVEAWASELSEFEIARFTQRPEDYSGGELSQDHEEFFDMIFRWFPTVQVSLKEKKMSDKEDHRVEGSYSKYKLFRQYMTNELRITRDDIEEWTKSAIRDQVSKLIGQINVDEIVRYTVREKLTSSRGSPGVFEKALNQAMADAIIGKIEVSLRKD